jgi:hypothetical protein
MYNVLERTGQRLGCQDSKFASYVITGFVAITLCLALRSLRGKTTLASRLIDLYIMSRR